jgi:hypothetical protein
MYAGEEVGKVVQLKPARAGAMVTDQDAGQAWLDTRMQAVGRAIFKSSQPITLPQNWQPSVVVVHNRGGFQFAEPAWLGMPIFLGDKLRTSSNYQVAIEFIIGGRVGINVDSAVRVATERSVEDVDVSVMRLIMRKGGMWDKTERMKEPIEIQTNGGVMGGLKG